MLGSKRTGSVVCPSCGRLVGASERTCPFCGALVRGVLGLEPLLRKLFGDLGLWPLVMGACGVLYLAMLAVDPEGMRVAGGGLGFLAPSLQVSFAFGASGPLPVLGAGRWWTLLSAGWLHGGALHVFFNLMWMRQLAPMVESIYGSARAIVIYVLAGASGFLFTTLAYFAPGLMKLVMRGPDSRTITLGASAALFGLLAALVHYGKKRGSSAIGQQAWTWALALFVFGFIFPGVDNWAHLGGFVGGWVLSALLDPLRPERPAHRLAAGLCLAASAAAIVASLVTARL
jgi:rhomboid protease GluP